MKTPSTRAIRGSLLLLFLPLLISSDLSDFQTLVKEWQNLQAEQNALQVQWKQEQSLLNQESELIDLELKNVRELIAQEQIHLKNLQDTLTQNEHLRAKTKQQTQQLSQQLKQSENHLLHFYNSLPLVLQNELSSFSQELTSADDKDLARQLQMTLAFYGKLQKLQQEVQILETPLELKGEKRKMTVIFLGLSCAFAVSADNQFAGRAFWQGNQFIWQQDNKIAAQVRLAIEIHQRRKSWAWITLPFRTHGEKK